MTRNAIEARKLQESERRRKQDAALGIAGLAVSGLTGGLGAIAQLRRGKAAEEGVKQSALSKAAEIAEKAREFNLTRKDKKKKKEEGEHNA